MGADKGLIPFKGKPMIERTIDIAQTVTENILIIANNEGYEQLGYPVYGDVMKEKGPIGGIHAGLTHSSQTYNLVLACDMPLLKPAFIEHMVEQINPEDKIVVPRHGEQIEPLCAIYHRECITRLESAAKSADLSMHGFIGSMTAKYVDIDELMPYYSPYLFSNANTMEELKELELLEA